MSRRGRPVLRRRPGETLQSGSVLRLYTCLPRASCRSSSSRILPRRPTPSLFTNSSDSSTSQDSLSPVGRSAQDRPARRPSGATSSAGERYAQTASPGHYPCHPALVLSSRSQALDRRLPCSSSIVTPRRAVRGKSSMGECVLREARRPRRTGIDSVTYCPQSRRRIDATPNEEVSPVIRCGRG